MEKLIITLAIIFSTYSFSVINGIGKDKSPAPSSITDHSHGHQHHHHAHPHGPHHH